MSPLIGMLRCGTVTPSVVASRSAPMVTHGGGVGEGSSHTPKYAMTHPYRPVSRLPIDRVLAVKPAPVIFLALSSLLIAPPALATDVRLEPVDEEEDEEVSVGTEFRFGSYGRVRAATDLRGNTARPTNVVSFGSRIDERSYAELEFQQRFFRPDDEPDFSTDIVATVGFLDDFFHVTGDFDQSIAVRNLYAQGFWHADFGDVDIWAGSRMYRGDDIYLLDFWPLDNLNTVGGGAGLSVETPAGPANVRVHAGANRLEDDYQRQVVDVPGLEMGVDQVVFMDRQRLIVAGRGEQQFHLDEGRRGLKAVLYGESHHLPEAQRRREDTMTEEGVVDEALPADSGWLFGGQVGLWEASGGTFDGSFVNVFGRYAAGLAAYGELGIPFGVNVEETAEGASEWLGGLAATAETPWGHATVGSYARSFDTAQDVDSHRDYREAIVATRLHGYVTDHFHPGVELSHQVRLPRGPHPQADDYERPQQQAPTVTKLSVIPAVTLEPEAFSRPQFRLIYTASFLNESAQELFHDEDLRRAHSTQHYFGVMAEWWFNSASY